MDGCPELQHSTHLFCVLPCVTSAMRHGTVYAQSRVSSLYLIFTHCARLVTSMTLYPNLVVLGSLSRTAQRTLPLFDSARRRSWSKHGRRCRAICHRHRRTLATVRKTTRVGPYESALRDDIGRGGEHGRRRSYLTQRCPCREFCRRHCRFLPTGRKITRGVPYGRVLRD